MAGLDPAIHVLVSKCGSKTWITGTSPVMTDEPTPVRYPTAEDWIASLPLAMTSAFEHASAFPQGNYLRVVGIILPPKSEGAGNAGRATHPQPCVQSKKARKQVTTGSPRHPGTPCANGFNGFLRALPGDRACCHRPRAMRSHCREFMPASRHQDHTTSPSANLHIRLMRRLRPPPPAPNVRDDRETPLCSEARDARRSAGDLPDVTSGMICDTLARRANQSSACQ
jgi:hypothetical protein